MNLKEAVVMWEDCQESTLIENLNCIDCPLYYCEGFDDGHMRICSHLSAAAALLRKQSQPKAEAKL